MPQLPLKLCPAPGCVERIHARKRFCKYHQTQKYRREYGNRDPFYNTAAWRRCRAAVLADEPLCRECKAPATVADHIVPRRQGGADYDRENLQSLCEQCHNRKRATEKN